MNANDVLSKAKHIIEGGRSKHGAENSFELIAKFWSVYLKSATKLPQDIDASNVAQMMVLLKIARSAFGEYNPDDFIDQAGYAAWASELKAEKGKNDEKNSKN